MSPEKLAYMANQIGRFFTTQPGGKAAAGIESHILKFWDVRMRKTLLDHLDEVPLDPPVREALEHLKQAQPS
ncbi:MAG TPA: formate dehydrogenase subunit delta [Rhodopila sp.]|nr:formate dehydrogenase subunit delta [Rhodopila sp.]